MESGLKASLRRIAYISAAACIWEKELSKIEIRKFLYSLTTEFNINQSRLYDEWYKIVKQLNRQIISHDLLPPMLYCELLSAVMYMGLRVHQWFTKLKRKIFFGSTSNEISLENYTKKIYWTHDGTIDEVKIFKMFWANNPDFDVCQMYKMACSYCLEQEVAFFWEQILKRNQVDSYNRNLDLDYERHLHRYEEIDKLILEYWADTRHPSDSFRLKLLEYVYGENENMNHSLEEDMLKICAKQGNQMGFKYFWNLLDDGPKKANGVMCLRLTLQQMDFLRNKENFRELSVFQFRNLSQIEKTKLVPQIRSGDFIDLVSSFISSWPWQESLGTELTFLLPYCDKSFFSQWIYRKLQETLESEVELGVAVDCSELGRQFRKLWRLTPSKFKFSLADYNFSRHNIGVWDLSTVKFILNDQDVVKHKRKILNDNFYYYYTFLEWIKKEEITKLEQFFCEVLVPGDLKEIDQKTLKTIYKLLLQNNLSSVDNFLNGNIFEDRATVLKEGYAIDFVCYYCIKTDQFDLADRILHWIYESKNKVKEYKESFRSNKFTMEHILDIWKTSKTNGDLAVSRCDNFLNWLTNFSEEGIRQFKIEEFTEKKIVGSYEVQGMDEELRDKFLSWCLPFSVEKIQEVKEILIFFKKCERWEHH